MAQATLVHGLLEHSARQRADRPFLIHDGHRHTYAEVETAAHRFARVLLELGVLPGDRVGLLLQNSPEFVEVYFGALIAGAVVVPLNAASGADTVGQCLSDSGANVLVAGPRFGKMVMEVARVAPELRTVLVPDHGRLLPEPPGVKVMRIEEAPGSAGDDRVHVELDADANAAIVYTSGSTGRPRGATLSHGNLSSNAHAVVSYLRLTHHDRVLQVLPFYYIYGNSILNTHAAVGASVVIENRFRFPNTALDTLESLGCTGFSGVPSSFAILLSRSDLARRKLDRLRYVTQAGGAMPPSTTQRLMDVLPRQKIYIMYGATEASGRLTYLEPEDLTRKLGSVGKAIEGTTIRVLRDDGSEAEPGEVGEVVASGDGIMSGYWGDPEETAAVLGPEGYHTGDLGKKDDGGFLYIVGRKKDMIKAGAHRISAREIEDAIQEHSAVEETAVIGVPDAIQGEAICAYVVLQPGVTSAETTDLEKFLRRRLPSFKVPSRLIVRGSLPKNESGKVLKEVLRVERAKDEVEST